MSDIAADTDLRARLAEIDRTQAETHKLVAETGKLNSEARKLLSEQSKLIAEEMKLHRERQFAPWLAYLGIIGGVLTVIGALLRLKGI